MRASLHVRQVYRLASVRSDGDIISQVAGVWDNFFRGGVWRCRDNEPGPSWFDGRGGVRCTSPLLTMRDLSLMVLAVRHLPRLLGGGGKAAVG
jgi:hypothetical protein